MATDYRRLVTNLLAFYDFKGKTVIDVGAGGGQLIEYGREAAKILAVDNDPQAVAGLKARLRDAGLEEKFKPILADFFEADLQADVVLFEFSLHEMRDPKAALERAGRMAPAVVVFDHAPGSEWAYFAAEEDKVAAGWAAIERLPAKKTARYEAEQFFPDFAELVDKVKGQGDISLARIERYKGRTGIRIPMSYGLALIAD